MHQPLRDSTVCPEKLEKNSRSNFLKTTSDDELTTHRRARERPRELKLNNKKRREKENAEFRPRTHSTRRRSKIAKKKRQIHAVERRLSPRWTIGTAAAVDGGEWTTTTPSAVAYKASIYTTCTMFGTIFLLMLLHYSDRQRRRRQSAEKGEMGKLKICVYMLCVMHTQPRERDDDDDDDDKENQTPSLCRRHVLLRQANIPIRVYEKEKFRIKKFGASLGRSLSLNSSHFSFSQFSVNASEHCTVFLHHFHQRVSCAMRYIHTTQWKKGLQQQQWRRSLWAKRIQTNQSATLILFLSSLFVDVAVCWAFALSHSLRYLPASIPAARFFLRDSSRSK